MLLQGLYLLLRPIFILEEMLDKNIVLGKISIEVLLGISRVESISLLTEMRLVPVLWIS